MIPQPSSHFRVLPYAEVGKFPGLRLALVLVLFTAELVRAQTEVKDAAAKEARTRALAGIAVRFPAYVFSGKEFPRCECEQPERARELLGPYTIRTSFHELTGAVVEQARQPGLYGAVVEVVPKEGPTLRRCVSLCATAGKPEAGWRFDAARPEALARWSGIEPDVVR
jgi:hypothetical protein